MVTAKIGGSTNPCTKRQKIIAPSVGAQAVINVGTESTTRAVTITRLRPSTSAMVPANGAVSATASVLAVMMLEISAALLPKSCDSSGRIACGEYKLRKAQEPARPTATWRVKKWRSLARLIELPGDANGQSYRFSARGQGGRAAEQRGVRCMAVLSERRFRALQGLLRCAGPVNLLPFHDAEIVALLGASDRGIRIGGIACALANTVYADRHRRGEEQTTEAGASPSLRDAGAFGRVGEHRVDDRRMAGVQHTARLIVKHFIDSFRCVTGVGFRRQSVGVGRAEHCLALDIAAQPYGARLRQDFRCQRARQQRLACTGKPADRDQPGRRRRQ